MSNVGSNKETFRRRTCCEPKLLFILFSTLLLIFSFFVLFSPASGKDESNNPSILDDSPEHLALIKMLKAEGKTAIIQTASRVAMNILEEFATVTIDYENGGEVTRTEVYLLRENGDWIAYRKLPTKKDHVGVFFILARRNCSSRYKHFKGMSYLDDSWLDKNSQKRTINFNCMELIDNQYNDHHLSLVFEYHPPKGWAITDSKPYQKPDAAQQKIVSKMIKLEKTGKKKVPTSLQEIMQMSDLQVAISTSYSQGEARALQLIASGADLQHKDTNEYTALHSAMSVKLPSGKIIQALLEAGAEVDAIDRYGYSPLHLLAQGANDADAPLVELLIAAGADVNGKDRKGGSSLHHMTVHGSASGCKALAVAQILIEAGADVNAKNEYGKTPLESAQEYHCDNFVIFLRKNGAR